MVSEHFKDLSNMNTEICNMICEIDRCNGKLLYSYYLPLTQEQEKLIQNVLLFLIQNGKWGCIQYRGEGFYCCVTRNKKRNFNFCFHTECVKEWDGKVRGNPYL